MEEGKPEFKGNIAWYMQQMGEMLGIAVTQDESEKMADSWGKAYEDSHEIPELFPGVTHKNLKTPGFRKSMRRRVVGIKQ